MDYGCEQPAEQRPIRWNRTRFHLIGHKLL